MRTRFNFKIHTVVLISLAFIFRLLLVNFCLVTSLKTPQNNKYNASHLSALLKKRMPDTAEVASLNLETHTDVEVCEENPDNEEDFVKAGSPVILSILFSFLKYITFIPKSNASFDLIKCNLYPKKYLALSVLRV